MSRPVSFALIGLAVVLIVIGFTEHLFYHGQIVPHLAYILGALAIIVAAVGVYGLLRRIGARA